MIPPAWVRRSLVTRRREARVRGQPRIRCGHGFVVEYFGQIGEWLHYNGTACQLPETEEQRKVVAHE